MDDKKGVRNILILSIIVLSIPIASADLFGDFKNFIGSITGFATQDTTAATVILASQVPFIRNEDIEPPPQQTITLGSHINVTFHFNVTDADGVGDLNFSTGWAYFNYTGEAERSDYSCAPVEAVNTTTYRFNCTVQMFWFDATGDWTINVSVKDNSSNIATNTNLTFNIAASKGMVMGPTALSWASIKLGDTNKVPTSNITINNTGNINIVEVNVTGFNLFGNEITTQSIPPSNFTVNITDPCAIGDLIGVDRLGNNTNVTVTSATAAKGNYTIGDGTAQEEIAFCLEGIEPAGGGLSVQTYATLGGWAWEINVA